MQMQAHLNKHEVVQENLIIKKIYTANHFRTFQQSNHIKELQPQEHRKQELS